MPNARIATMPELGSLDNKQRPASPTLLLLRAHRVSGKARASSAAGGPMSDKLSTCPPSSLSASIPTSRQNIATSSTPENPQRSLSPQSCESSPSPQSPCSSKLEIGSEARLDYHGYSNHCLCQRCEGVLGPR